MIGSFPLPLAGEVLVTAFILSFVATPLAGYAARRLGLVAKPRHDRWHEKATPLLGGIAIFVGFALAALGFVNFTPETAGLLIGATLIFVLGLVDDVHHLRPYVKLAVQIVAACILVIARVQVTFLPYPFLTIPLTIFWVIGITNAFNLLDNIDGLAAGTGAIVGLSLFAHNAISGDAGTAVACLVLAGAALGFLVHNFKPARIFMGDSGSLTIGFVLAGLALMGAHRGTGNVFATLLVPVAIMALPIFDTTLVTIARTFHRRPVSQGGRDHLSHRLVALGLSERQAVLTLYVISALSGAMALASTTLDLWTAFTLAALLAIGIVLFGIFLADVHIYSEEDYGRLHQFDLTGRWSALGGVLLYKRQMAEILLDFLLICLAYLAAYLLKFESNFSGSFLGPFAQSLPYVICVKITVLFLFGVYRPVWHYAGIADVRRIAEATAAGSVAVVVVLTAIFRFEGYSRSVFVIDWLVLTTLLIGARLSFSAMRDYFARLPRRDGTRVLIVGAGDVGEMVLRTIYRDPHRTYQPVGFLDDDPEKQNRAIHGVPILGSTRDLMHVINSYPVIHEVVLTPHHASAGSTADVVSCCATLGIPCRDAGSFLALHLGTGNGKAT